MVCPENWTTCGWLLLRCYSIPNYGCCLAPRSTGAGGSLQPVVRVHHRCPSCARLAPDPTIFEGHAQEPGEFGPKAGERGGVAAIEEIEATMRPAVDHEVDLIGVPPPRVLAAGAEPRRTQMD